MPTPPHRPVHKRLRIADLRGIAQLATQATTEVTSISEGLHQAIWRTLGAPSGATRSTTRGITGFVYRSIHGVTRWVGKSVDQALVHVESVLDSDGFSADESSSRAALVSALNGVVGDHLHDSNNPLATAMTIRHRGLALETAAPIEVPESSGHLLLMIHGLCMNDRQWSVPVDDVSVDHGASLSAALGSTPLYLRYNSGRHVSENGRLLAHQLEQLLTRWPQPVMRLSVVAHSMGGLVMRSALQHAQTAGLAWPQQLRHIVFLGTPHHGAPLERAGNWLDLLLAATPYSAPFAKLGQMRSAGITDLRHGYVSDADWHGRDRFVRGHEHRRPLPLPAGVRCYAIAATTAAERSPVSERVIGDGLVPLASALGQHDSPEHTLDFSESNQHIVYRTNHMQLLSRPEVTAKILHWLAADG